MQELRNLGADIILDVKELQKEKLEVRVMPSLLRLWPNVIQDIFPSPDVDKGTSSRFLRRWSFNFFRRIREEGSIQFLKSIETDYKSCLYCGAGPGLYDDLQLLSTSIENMLIISSDTALAPLLNMGIRPHLIISVDSGRGTE